MHPLFSESAELVTAGSLKFSNLVIYLTTQQYAQAGKHLDLVSWKIDLYRWSFIHIEWKIL